jgi:hypothetical protein
MAPATRQESYDGPRQPGAVTTCFRRPRPYRSPTSHQSPICHIRCRSARPKGRPVAFHSLSVGELAIEEHDVRVPGFRRSHSILEGSPGPSDRRRTSDPAWSSHATSPHVATWLLMRDALLALAFSTCLPADRVARVCPCAGYKPPVSPPRRLPRRWRHAKIKRAAPAMPVDTDEAQRPHCNLDHAWVG